MKILFVPVVAAIALLTLNNPDQSIASVKETVVAGKPADNSPINFQDQSDGKMSSNTFKNQDYCRAELANFEFDVKFDVVGATVYFSGANFKGTERGAINSNSLKPIKELMNRCQPGSIIIFDEVKVIGPDKKLRTIPGAVYKLF